MALFKVNTGLRQAEVANLRWEWEVEIPELETPIFVIPREHTKYKLDRYVALNRIARSIIESCRGKHPEVVFTYKGNPIPAIYNSGWKAARRSERARRSPWLGLGSPKELRTRQGLPSALTRRSPRLGRMVMDQFFPIRCRRPRRNLPRRVVFRSINLSQRRW
jgi:hypothetical protein